MAKVSWDKTRTKDLKTGRVNSSGHLRVVFLGSIVRSSDLEKSLFWLMATCLCAIGVAAGSRWLGAPEVTAVALSFALALVKLLCTLLETYQQLALRASSSRTDMQRRAGDSQGSSQIPPCP